MLHNTCKAEIKVLKEELANLKNAFFEEMNKDITKLCKRVKKHEANLNETQEAICRFLGDVNILKSKMNQQEQNFHTLKDFMDKSVIEKISKKTDNDEVKGETGNTCEVRNDGGEMSPLSRTLGIIQVVRYVHFDYF